MNRSQVLEMAHLLIQNQKKSKFSKEVSYVLLDSYVCHSGFAKEDILMFLKDQKMPLQKCRQISFGIVIFQIGRRGLIEASTQLWWDHYISFFCKFEKSLFLGYTRETWLEFFLSCCECRKRKEKPYS